MPLRAELPAGQKGTQALSSAITVTVMCIAVFVYGLLGIFAAARSAGGCCCACVSQPAAASSCS